MHEISGLLPAEKRLKACATSGALADLRTGIPEHDDFIHGQAWPAGRTVRAEVIASLAFARQTRERGSFRHSALLVRESLVISTSLVLKYVEQSHSNIVISMRRRSSLMLGLVPFCLLGAVYRG